MTDFFPKAQQGTVTLPPRNQQMPTSLSMEETIAAHKNKEDSLKNEPVEDLNGQIDLSVPSVPLITDSIDELVNKHKKLLTNPPEEVPVEPIVVVAAPELGKPIINEENLDVASVANFFYDNEILKGIPEGFDTNNLNLDTLKELVAFNIEQEGSDKFNLGIEEGQNNILNRISDSAYDVIRYSLGNPNTDDEDVKNYMAELVYGSSIDRLSPEIPSDAETIVRQYYQGIGDHSHDEIDSIIEGIKASGSLEKQAGVFKPKLKARIDKQKLEHDDYIIKVKAAEEHAHKQHLQKVRKVLENGIDGLKLEISDKNTVWAALANNNVIVPVAGNKKAQLGYLESLLYKHRYTDTGNTENLILATLILEGKGDLIKKHYLKNIKAEVAVETARRFSTSPSANQAPNFSNVASKLNSPEAKAALFQTLRRANK